MTEGARTLTRGPLRGAVVGYGFISERGHVPAYGAAGSAQFEIVAVADTCAARRAKARAALPGARIYDTHGEMLSAERGRIDFVDVSTPPAEHARVALDALSHGLHVLCEKPLATTAEEARAMVTQAREVRRVLFPCHNYKHAPVIKAVREILDGGTIGKPSLVTLQTFRNTHAKGVDEWRRDWRREKRYSGGGIAMDHGSHTFYLAFDWLGEYPTGITAKMSTLGDFDTEDNFACAMTFPSGTATAHLSWTAGVRKVIYTIHGTRGAIRVEDDDVEVAVLKGDHDARDGGNGSSHGGGDSSAPVGPAANGHGASAWETRKIKVASEWMDASHVHWFRSLFTQFADAVRSGDFVSRETESSVRCVELITSAYASAIDHSREHRLRGGL